MKIQMSLDEAQKTLLNLFAGQYHGTAEVNSLEITYPQSSPASGTASPQIEYIHSEAVDALKELQAYWEAITQHTFPNQKITAIKYLRDKIPGLGLVEAKYVVESHTMDVVKYIVTMGTLKKFK